jgi:hypothetical protein
MITFSSLQISKQSSSPAPAPSPLLNNLVSYWKLDDASTGTAIDSIGSNNGTVILGALQNQTGKIGKAISVVTGNSRQGINCGNNTNLQLSNVGSISCWIYPTTLVGSVSIISKGNWATDRNGYVLVRYADQLYMEICDASGVAFKTTPAATLVLNQWQHVVGTWEYGTNNHITLYVNTVSYQGALDRAALSTVSNFYIGNDGANNNYPFLGSIDELGVWNKELTQSDVSTLFNNGSGLTYPFS